MNWWQRRGLRFKIALLVGLSLAVVLGAIFAVFIVVARNYLRDREVQMALQSTALLQGSIRGEMLNNNWQNVAQEAYDLGKKSEDPPVEDIAIYAQRKDPGAIDYTRTTLAVFVTGFPEGRKIAQSSLEKKEYSVECAVCHTQLAGQREEWMRAQLEGQEVIRITRGIENEEACQKCHSQDEQVLGMILVDFSQRKFQETSRLATFALAGAALLTLALVSLALFLLVNVLVIRPLRGMVSATQSIAQGNWDQRMAVRSGDEVGKLGTAFNEMTDQLAGAYAELQRALAERGEKTAELQRALEEVQRGHAAQDQLLLTIREMSTPVIPVQRGVLVMPLVGIIDSQRAQGILSALLAAIEKERARVIILDITGVPMVDTAVAQTLLQAARAARLLGTEPILVGISPQVAETIISLGVDLTDLVTRADLQSGVEYALQQLRPAR